MLAKATFTTPFLLPISFVPHSNIPVGHHRCKMMVGRDASSRSSDRGMRLSTLLWFRDLIVTVTIYHRTQATSELQCGPARLRGRGGFPDASRNYPRNITNTTPLPTATTNTFHISISPLSLTPDEPRKGRITDTEVSEEEEAQ